MIQYPKKYKVAIEEVDTGTEITKADEQTYKYATNLSLNVQYGEEYMKHGYGFGVTLERQKKNSISYKTISNSDDLGSVWVEYTHPVIKTVSGAKAEIYCYTTGYVDFMVLPSKLYD